MIPENLINKKRSPFQAYTRMFRILGPGFFEWASVDLALIRVFETRYDT